MVSGQNSYAVGVTTSDRKEPTLIKCVASINQAGWVPHVYSEPNNYSLKSLQNSVCKYELHQRQTKGGAWYNWYEMANELVKLDVDVVITVQDDTVFSKDLRGFLDEDLWPSDNVGYVSLYTSSKYQLKRNGVYGECFPLVVKGLWGACALAFPRHTLKLMLKNRIMAGWKGARPKEFSCPSEIKNVDTAIGLTSHKLKKEAWFYNPSLSTHISKHSTLSNGGNNGNRNCENFLADQPPQEVFDLLGVRYNNDKTKRVIAPDDEYGRNFKTWNANIQNVKLDTSITQKAWSFVKNLLSPNAKVLEFGGTMITPLVASTCVSQTVWEMRPAVFRKIDRLVPDVARLILPDYDGWFKEFPDDTYDIIIFPRDNHQERIKFLKIVKDFMHDGTKVLITKQSEISQTKLTHMYKENGLFRDSGHEGLDVLMKVKV